MPAYLETPVLPESPSPSPLASCSSQKRKGKKSGGLLRNIKRSVLILVGQEEKLSLRKRKVKNERFPPQINVPPPSSSHASASRVTPRLLQTPSTSRASQNGRNGRRETVLSVLGISLQVSSPSDCSSVRSSINGSPMPSPAPSSCASSRPTSVRSGATRTSATNLPRGRRNSHQYKWQSENRPQGKGDRVQLPWLSSADEDASSMASFMAAVAHAGEGDSPQASVRRASPSVVRTASPSADDKTKEVKRSASVSSRNTKSPTLRQRPAPLLEIPEVKCSRDVLGSSFDSYSTETADVLSAALRSINTSL